MEWLLAHMDPRERVVRGPTQRLPSWQYTGVFRFKTVPAGTMSWSRMAEIMSEADATYFIVDVGVFRERHQLLSQFFEQVDEDRLRLRALPLGWELAYAEPQSADDLAGLPRECTYCLLRKVDPPPGPPVTLPEVDFGDRVRLLGYYLPNPAVRAGDTLQVILYWQGLVQMHEDYAVALRLVGEDGQIYAQQDGLTVEGRFVTTGWPPGDTVADLHDLAVPPETPAGAYRLEVDVYQPQTGERLEAGGPGAAGHRAAIPNIAVEAAR